MFGTTIGSTMGHVGGHIPGRKLSRDMTYQNKETTPKTPTMRGQNYIADYGGCGHWRMMWPSHLINSYQRGVVHNTSKMISDPQYYNGITSVRVQRQVSADQRKFFDFLKKISAQTNSHLMYDIDDVFIYDDIPGYNKFKSAYKDPSLKENGLSIMRECTEVTVTCNYMKKYYNQWMNNVTVIPNYMPRFWLDRYYDENRLEKNYTQNVKKRKKPRVLYAASGAHFDVTGRNKNQDDFSHVADVVRRTCNEIQWVFVGGYPPYMKDLLDQNKIEFHPWVWIPDYPKMIHNLNVNLTIAPLMDNTFNRCKSDLKFIEAGAFGLPCMCQDLVTYTHAHHKFTSGDELIDNIKSVLVDKSVYMKACRKARQYADTRWLEDHIDKYVELYSFPRSHANRKQLNLLQLDNTI